MILFLLGLCVFSHLPQQNVANAPASDSDRIAAVRRLYDEGHWEEAARLAQGASDQPPELDYLAGMSLARLQRWKDARDFFTSGQSKAPRDIRFLLEGAGASYRLNDFRSAKADLRAALVVNPQESYAREFLGTLYLLEGNLEAALKYWNPIEKPRLGSVAFDPAPHLRAELRNRAVTFSAPAVLNLDALRTTEARLQNLDAFVQERVDLTAADGDTYDATIRTTHHAGWRDGPLVGVISLLRGLPYETVYPEFFDLGDTATNVTSLLRWDDQKRRVSSMFSTPVRENPGLRFSFFVDARNESWNLTRTFFGAAAPLDDLNMRRLAGGIALRSVANGRWSWSSGIEAVARKFRNLNRSISLDALPFFTGGTSLASWLRVEHPMLQVPERRFRLDATGEVKIGRGFADGLGGFAAISGSLRMRWLPRARGDDYQVVSQLRGADTFGRVPLDQLFQLGIERDNDLWMRGHAGTTDGRKGRAPLGRRYLLLNSEIDKHIFDFGFLGLKLGPFLDTGVIADPSGFFGSQRWLWDTGLQCKVRIAGNLTVLLSYGRDLRTAQNVFYATVSR